ncbi:MAG: hypothetical protein IKX81_05985 [Firmicutes bacterium]|nr:hypothetical protein [Bacillota bacterium]
MSFRPTISVYFNGEMADIGYYRNWREESLILEAVAIAIKCRDMKTAEEYRDRVFGTQTVYYRIDPERWENTPENLKRLESCSEMPLLVDMTARCIYVSYGALPRKIIDRIPEAKDMEDFVGHWYSREQEKSRKITLTDEMMDRVEAVWYTYTG